MKFINYLNEENSYTIEDVKRECSDAIALCKKNKFYFKRYSSKYPWNYTDIERVIPRQNRKPTSTKVWMHNALNKILKKKFGWNVRNGVFTYIYPITNIANTNTIFLPVNGFKLVYDPDINDLYTVIYNYGSAIDTEVLADMVENYTDSIKDLKLAAQQIAEIMFNCNAYYLIGKNFYNEILNLFK